MSSDDSGVKLPVKIGKYNVVGKFAHGGMGEVFLAEDPDLNYRKVIIKRLVLNEHIDNSDNISRFKREADILLDFQNQNIIKVYSYIEENGAMYIAEEFVDGLSLDVLIKKMGKLPCQLALTIFSEICNGIKFSHKNNVIHRDIKPGNILLSKKADVKITDFGIALNERSKDISENPTGASKMRIADIAVTQTGMAIGTPSYMAPEQFEDAASVSKGADVYAMGIMLFEMLTGKRPYESKKTFRDTYQARKKFKYDNLLLLWKEKVPFSVIYMIWRMITFQKDKRYDSIDPVIRIVRKYISHYEYHELRVNLAKAVRMYMGDVDVNKKYTIKDIPEKKEPVKFWSGVGFSVAIFVFFMVLIGKTGFFYKTFLSHWYKGVNISLVIPETQAPVSDLPASVSFYKGEFFDEKVKGAERYFNYEWKLDSNDIANNRFNIKTAYLKEGKYRVRFTIGNFVNYQDVYVGKNGLNLKFDFLKNARCMIQLHVQAVDIETGNLIERPNIFVFYAGRWAPLNTIPRDKLLSGQSWMVKCSATGYLEEVFEVKDEWYQNEIFIFAKLQKKK